MKILIDEGHRQTGDNGLVLHNGNLLAYDFSGWIRIRIRIRVRVSRGVLS